jgi:hypothetical protein
MRAGSHFGRTGRFFQWWIGDWLLYGNARWGEKYGRASKLTGYHASSLRNMVWVASRFDPERRRIGLSFGHHKLVAHMPVEEQERWLDRATAERLSCQDLHIVLKAERRDTPAVQERVRRAGWPTSITCPSCGVDFDPLEPAACAGPRHEEQDASGAERAGGKVAADARQVAA